jgi:hypothetical protein
MEEKIRSEGFIPSHPTIMDVAKGLSDASRSAGRYKFLITFTATKGNLDSLQKFQKFCFEHCNNEYLVAITRLMDYASIFEYLKNLEARISLLEQELASKEAVSDEPSKKDMVPETF